MDSGEERGSGEGHNVRRSPDGEMEFQGRGHWNNVVSVIDDVKVWHDAKVTLLLLSLHLLDGQVFCKNGSDACLDCGDRHLDVVEVKVLARLESNFFGIPLAEAGGGDGQTVGVRGIEAVEGEMPVGVGG